MSVGADPFEHRPRRLWRRVSVELPADLAEAAADLLAEISGSGVEVVHVPPAFEGGARERVIGYLAEDGQVDGEEARLRRELEAIRARSGNLGAVAVRSDSLLEEDWGAGWKKHFRPFRAAPRLVIKPTWEPCEPEAGEAVIEMDPGMAFGTGLHASTRLALGFMEEVCAGAPPSRALDIGTGTGILAMAAALWGAAEVVAIDNDPDAVAAARRNVALNAVADKVSVGGQELAAIGGAFDLIAANITADVLHTLAPMIAERLAPGAPLVLAGLLAGEQAREVRTAYEGFGLMGALERVEGEWAALLLFAPDGQEVFEVTDEQGQAIGRAPRAACHRNPALVHRVSHVIVTDGGGRVYLQKRPLTKDIEPGRWDTSVGGHLDRGESHEAGAAREMREELNLAGPLRFLHRYLWRTERETELIETFSHVATAEPRPLPGEIEEGRWFTPAEAAELVARGKATPHLAEELRLLSDRGR
jgi:ribosomal protein L11 methyltransferase